MKTLFPFLLVILIAASCSNKNEPEKKHELTNAEKEIAQLKNVDEVLSDSKEKIALLSAVKGVHYDTLYSILKDYYYKLDGNSNNDTLVNTAIIYTTEKHGLTKSKIASCIFSFQYEMLTNDEITEKVIREHEDLYSEPTENNYH